jgi:phosphopantothenoylcysteine synthetase/decarboxylase
MWCQFKRKKKSTGNFWWNCAYKTTTLVRLFYKAGAHVQVIMTPASKDFVLLYISTLSKTQFILLFYSKKMKMNCGIITLNWPMGWFDGYQRPATANTCLKWLQECDNLLLATYLSAKCHILLQQWTWFVTNILLLYLAFSPSFFFE